MMADLTTPENRARGMGLIGAAFGLGLVMGPLLGGLLVGIVEPFAGRYLPSGVGQIAPYVLMLLVLILRPGGLFAQISQKKV